MHLQQSLNKLGVGSGAEERVGREEGAASVQLVGRSRSTGLGLPVFWGMSEPVSGQAEVPDLLPL